jgi:hypothetical protein
METGIINVFSDSSIYPDGGLVLETFQKAANAAIAGDFMLSQVFPLKYLQATECKIYIGQEDYSEVEGRGVNGGFPRKDWAGYTEKTYTPGYFGESRVISEGMAIKIRNARDEARLPMMADHTSELMRIGMNAMVRRMKSMAHTFAYTGKLVVKNKEGAMIYEENVPAPGGVIGTLHSDSANSTPVADIMDRCQLLTEGSETGSFAWDQSSTICITPQIMAAWRRNRNANDLWGHMARLNIVPGAPGSIMQVFEAMGGPKIQMLNENRIVNGVRVPYALTDTILFIGSDANRGLRSGVFQVTDNYQAGSAQIFAKVIPDVKELMPPEVVTGFNGGVGIYETSQMYRMKVL